MFRILPRSESGALSGIDEFRLVNYGKLLILERENEIPSLLYYRKLSVRVIENCVWYIFSNKISNTLSKMDLFGLVQFSLVSSIVFICLFI